MNYLIVLGIAGGVAVLSLQPKLLPRPWSVVVIDSTDGGHLKTLARYRSRKSAVTAAKQGKVRSMVYGPKGVIEEIEPEGQPDSFMIWQL